jgi:hypothetical protein
MQRDLSLEIAQNKGLSSTKKRGIEEGSMYTENRRRERKTREFLVLLGEKILRISSFI